MSAIEGLGAVEPVPQILLVGSAENSERLAVNVIEGDIVGTLLAHPADLHGIVVPRQVMTRNRDVLVDLERSCELVLRWVAVAVLFGWIERSIEERPVRHNVHVRSDSGAIQKILRLIANIRNFEQG